jgi:uncharacterized protein
MTPDQVSNKEITGGPDLKTENDMKLNEIISDNNIDWNYPDLKRLTDREAKMANKERNELLKSISKGIEYSFMQSKIKIGKLSPGCLICGQGYWSCMYINVSCTASCFYCPQDRRINKGPSRTETGIIFDKPKDYVDYLEKFNFKGVGFAGGEPFLVFEKLSAYIKEIRERFGKKFYLWLYTNGDLVDKNKLIRLKESGLDEIRFNISARNYNLSCAELAVNIINTVTVEIPAIPEDYVIVKRCLKKMQEIGVKHLNIHQLKTTPWNYKNFSNRNYTFLKQNEMPILESEMTVLKLLRTALDDKISLPINYCSCAYKDKSQIKCKSERFVGLVRENFDEITSRGYIRRLSIQDSPARVKQIVRIIKRSNCGRDLWALNDSGTEIFLRGSLIKYIDLYKYNLVIRYFTVQLRDTLSPGEKGMKIVLNSNKKVFLVKELVKQQKGLSAVAMRSLQKLFLQNMKERPVLSHFYREYNLKTMGSLNNMKKEKALLMGLKTWERSETGLPELF